MKRPMAALSDEERTIVRAWTEVGSHPAYHRAQMERLQRDWPSMARAIEALVASVQK